MEGSRFNYSIGSLFPSKADGTPNLLTGDDLHFDPARGVVSSRSGSDQQRLPRLRSRLGISTDPVSIPGADRFLKRYLLPQLFATGSGDDQANSIFNQFFSNLQKQWLTKPRNRTMATLVQIGYQGKGANSAAKNTPFWNAVGTQDDPLFDSISNRSNYNPRGLWRQYTRGEGRPTTVRSTFDKSGLLSNLDALNNPSKQNPDLWYPTLLYTYGEETKNGRLTNTSYPGPVLMLQPGSKLELDFNNRLKVPGLNQRQLQQSTLIRNSTFGNSASEGLGGTTSTNYHLHGSHTTPTGFGDNVVARYTAGQRWTTEIDLPSDHGQGSYWYHPHYHPSVNQQVYGGLSGFMQLGDPLSRVPALQDVPRNLAILKNIDLGVAKSSGDLRITSFDGSFFPGTVTNQATMVTVNGEFQPTADAKQGGWQALTLSNQSNQAFYNVSLIHRQKGDGEGRALPLYIYGEDGHQSPEIRRAKGTLGTLGSGATTQYSQKKDLISLAPGKRIDLLAYLPKGKTEVASTYSFDRPSDGVDPETFLTRNMGSYPDLSRANQFVKSADNPFASPGSSSGPLAIFDVKKPVAKLSEHQQDAFIRKANSGIETQTITPDTREEDYDPMKVPSVDLFAESSDGSEIWSPVREREFNWARGTLVGPADERDPATQQALEGYTQRTGKRYKRYRQLPVGAGGLDRWLGYENPFLINDHVFPNGNLTIAQLGTIEQWRLRNWSVNTPEKYIGHPFHIHINDYQTKHSDTELSDKRNLEDVTMLNASGFKYYNSTQKKIVEAEPLKGEFHSIPQAQSPERVGSLATWGANDQTIRMLFQDYLGTYVFHCHILPHEDAGMMQAVMVVENTGSSWLLPGDGLEALTRQNQNGDKHELDVYLAQDFAPSQVELSTRKGAQIQRGQAGDISGDFTQDLLISSRGDGRVRLVDGARLADEGSTEVLANLKPYGNALAPWAYADDFTGDGRRDLITGGFVRTSTRKSQGSGNTRVSLHNFRIKAFTSKDGGSAWTEEFKFDPWDFIGHHHGHHGHGGQAVSREPVKGLSADQVGFTIGDFNLDNFNDFALAYAVHGGFRVTLLDGAAFSLLYQTGQLEGGFFPDSTVLGDALIADPSISGLRDIDLTAGFNSYAQSAIENLVITTDGSHGRQQLTMQLDAGHFIATSEIKSDTSPGSSHGHGHAHGGGVTFPLDDRVINLPTQSESLPLHLSDQSRLPEGQTASTPTFSSAIGNGALMLGDRLLVAQGNGFNGIDSSSDRVTATSQQLVVDLPGLKQVSVQDLLGVRSRRRRQALNQGRADQLTGTKRNKFSAAETERRNNLASLTSIAYSGRLPTPGTLSIRAAQLADGSTPAELVNSILNNSAASAQVKTHFGGSLQSLPVSTIVSVTTRTLFDRDPTDTEQRVWSEAVQSGLDPSQLPLAILETTQGNDRFRVGFLSNATQWNALQWGHDGNVSGSFGQGFLPSENRFKNLNDFALSSGRFSSWDEAQKRYNSFMTRSIDVLGGTPVSESGFF
ncbi:multicopper oxidase domain-containing protein [Cyanobium sp. LEGE 06143]|nr:multicopper oxidase domain-containing protein [Cyanobium sp. LEGE 06143]